jgi:hypothetical protein
LGFGLADGSAGGVVVVAEVLVTEGGRGAAAAGGVDVAAVIAGRILGFGLALRHKGLPLPLWRQSLGLIGVRVGLGLCAPTGKITTDGTDKRRIKAMTISSQISAGSFQKKSQAGPRFFSDLTFNYTGVRVVTMPTIFG